MIERKLGEYELPKNCYIIAAGNTTADKAVAYKLSSALRNRMSMVTLESNAKEWCVYGLMNEVDSRVIGYISARPESLCGEITATDAFATPRSWFNLSKVIKEETDMDVILSLASSLIGTPTAIESALVTVALGEEKPVTTEINKKIVIIPIKMDFFISFTFQ